MSEERQEQTSSTVKAANQSFLKAQTIKTLRGTINVLEGVVDKLEAEPETQIATTISSEEVGEITEEFNQEVTTFPTPEPIEEVPTQLVEAETTEVKQETPPGKTRFFDKILPNFPTVETWWDDNLDKIRSLLPTSVSEKLSDWGLTGILVTIVVIMLWTGVALLPQRDVQIAQEQETLPPLIEAPQELSAPQEPQPIQELPPPPPPEPKLTPEQGLIAAIQKQTAEITNQYAEGLVNSIEADFVGSNLTVKVSDDWYELTPSRQSKLANKMLAKAQKLDFRKLKITNIEGKLLARSPVVGSEMIVLQDSSTIDNSQLPN
ncbi:MAG: hypothetical protein WA865_23530 [Spirulinaceae cyanobacterium]